MFSHLSCNYILLVVDGNPAHPPARDEESLGEATYGQDGDGVGEARHGNVDPAAGEHKVLVDFIRNNWDLERTVLKKVLKINPLIFQFLLRAFLGLDSVLNF